MTRNLSKPARQAIFAQQTDKVFIVLVTISHPDWEDDVRYSSDPTELLPEANIRGTISRELEFLFIPFELKMPTQDDTGVARATIAIDNINREIVNRVRQASSALRIKIEVVMNTSPDVVEMSLDNFRLEKATYDAFTVSGEISLQYFDLEPFPSKQFTPSDFPGLF